MRLRNLSVILFLPLAAVVAYAGDSVDETRAVPSEASIKIKNVRGEVDIIGWDEGEIRVSGELDDLTEDFIFDVDGDSVWIEVKLPPRDVNWGDGSDLHIRVPEGSRVSFEGVSTDLRVENVQGGVQLRTVSGDIEVDGVATRVILNSISGDIEVRNATGRTQASTISGEIDLDIESTDLQVESVSGDVEVQLKAFERFYSRNVSGETEVEGELMAKGDVDMSSVSGDVQLKLERPVNAELFIRSGIGGDIENRLNDVRPKDVFPSQQELRAIVGDGSGRISINTVTADIKLD